MKVKSFTAAAICSFGMLIASGYAQAGWAPYEMTKTGRSLVSFDDAGDKAWKKGQEQCKPPGTGRKVIWRSSKKSYELTKAGKIEYVVQMKMQCFAS